MKINDVIRFLESLAHPDLQEHYDNAGLITGHPEWECKGILCSLDATEPVIEEAIERGCNLVVAHHPIIFGGLKKINGKNYVERTVINAIKNDIAIYAIHTNLDNRIDGVNGKIASMLGLQQLTILQAKQATLKKLYTFVPEEKAEQVRAALFAAGAGSIGNYDECSFGAEGFGTFRAGSGTNPYVGEQGKRHTEKEIKLEVIFPSSLERSVVSALKTSHPYEEVAFDLVLLQNPDPRTGAGIVGELEQPLGGKEFLDLLAGVFNLQVIRHTALTDRPVKKVAVCGGAGSFLISKALASGADAYVTADMKYHEFFDAEGRLLVADIGHFESEQFTISLLQEQIAQKFPTFAVLKTSTDTNPVHYYTRS